MSDNNQVKNTNQSSTSTVTAPTPPASTSGSTSTFNSQSTGQALAGALWEALSKLTTALNECVDVERQIGLQAQIAANQMTNFKATADKAKSHDAALQYYFDVGAQGVGALCTAGSMIGTGLANRGPSNELDGISAKITKLDTAKVNVDTALPNQPGNGALVQGENPNQNPQAAADVNVFTPAEQTRVDQLKNEDLFGPTAYTPEQDHALFSRMQDADKTLVKANIKKHMEQLDLKKNTCTTTLTRNQGIGDMWSKLITSTGTGVFTGLRGMEQEDIGSQDKNSTEAGNIQQQMAGLIGTAGSAQNKMADSASQAIQTYGQMAQSNANPNR